MMVVVRLELSLDEADLVGAVVCRDRDRLLDDALGNHGTRLITEQEEAVVPVHQSILRKLEASVTAPQGPQKLLNKAIDAIVGIAGSPGAELGKADLGKVRELCEAFSADALAIAIDVHRASCRQDDCPVLAVMVVTASARASSEALGAEHGS